MRYGVLHISLSIFPCRPYTRPNTISFPGLKTVVTIGGPKLLHGAVDVIMKQLWTAYIVTSFQIRFLVKENLSIFPRARDKINSNMKFDVVTMRILYSVNTVLFSWYYVLVLMSMLMSYASVDFLVSSSVLPRSYVHSASENQA